VTQDVGSDYFPQVSPNGRWLVFQRRLRSDVKVWVKDLQTGVETSPPLPNLRRFWPMIDDTGELLVSESKTNGVHSILWARRGRPELRVCTACQGPASWFDGNRGIFYRSYGGASAIFLGIPEKGEARPLVSSPDMAFYEFSWSPANQYLLFTAASSSAPAKHIYAVRFPRDTAQSAGPWIPIVNDAAANHHPVWSADGKTIYYLTDRDGSLCLWSVPFDARTGKTSGPPTPVLHFHSARLGPGIINSALLGMSMGGDSIYLNMGEQAQTIWMGKFKQSLLSPLTVLAH
jgi:WD40 repeat protein